MDTSYEIKYHEIESAGFWFRARRDVILRLLSRTPKNVSILDIGCSGGVLMRDLASAGFSNISGVDVSERAILRCQQRGLVNVQVADATDIGFPEATFDIVIASDILEHMTDEIGALCEWRRLLRPNGRLIVFVPAHRFLWSNHDIVNHHVKRYEKKEFKDLFLRLGFSVERFGYWNFLFFLPACIVYAARKILGEKEKEGDRLSHTPWAVNSILFHVLKIENYFLTRGLRFPFGVSLFAVVVKKGAQRYAMDV